MVTVRNAKVAPLSPVGLADAAVTQQGALSKDAKTILEQAAKARETCEGAVSAAETAHVAALQASASDRSNEMLLDAASRAGVRLTLARNDLASAVAKHEQAAASARGASANLEHAGRTLKIAQLQAQLEDGSHEAEMEAHVRAIVDAALQVRDRMLAIRARLTADAELVRELHGLGGPATVQAPDGTSAAGHLAATLLQHGASVPTSRGTLHDLRHPFSLPTPARPDVDAAGATTQLVALILASIKQGAENPYARPLLEKAAEAWRGARHYLSGAARFDALDRTEADARAAGERSAHEKRLADLHARARAPSPQQAAQVARAEAARAAQPEHERRLAANGKARDAANAARVREVNEGHGLVESPDGQWSIGPDFSADVPTVG